MSPDRPAATSQTGYRRTARGRAEPELAPAEAAPTLAEHTIEPTRTSLVGTMVASGWSSWPPSGLHPPEQPAGADAVRDGGGHPPLGVARLFAPLLGGLLVLVAGTARVLQLRVVARRHRHTNQRP